MTPGPGRAAFVASFRQFAEVAKTRGFVGGAAGRRHRRHRSRTCPFTIAYALEGATYREKGFDMLVFPAASEDGKLWRTLISEPEPQE
jgi:hypothetical protein